jgi:hypothetical protein
VWHAGSSPAPRPNKENIMDIPKALQDSVCAAILRMENGWMLLYEGNSDTPSMVGFTISEEAETDSKEAYDGAVDCLYKILEDVLWMPNSKHKPYRIEIKIVNQLSTKGK